MLWFCIAIPFFIFPPSSQEPHPSPADEVAATANMYLLSNLIDSFDIDDNQF